MDDRSITIFHICVFHSFKRVRIAKYKEALQCNFVAYILKNIWRGLLFIFIAFSEAGGAEV